jgi:hypothetical protein
VIAHDPGVQYMLGPKGEKLPVPKAVQDRIHAGLKLENKNPQRLNTQPGIPIRSSQKENYPHFNGKINYQPHPLK